MPESAVVFPQTGAGQNLYTKALKLIPGGVQLLSKRREMFLPEQWPAYYARAQGAYVWDLDGRRYLDVSHCGVGTCVLGYADPDVDRAVMDAIRSGTMCTLNCPEEVELAELLVDLHPWAEMVRFARGGGDAMAVAVRIARAATHRDKIAFCGYHGWHDWYLAANLSSDSALDGHLLPGLSPRGAPRGLTGTMLPFRYGDLSEFRAIIERHGNELAAIVMEPARSSHPPVGFLEEIRRTADSVGAVLIFDEVTSGWRVNTGGIHLTFGVQPDIAVFAKAMSNGYAMAAVAGVREVMKAAQDSFISSTYWTERVGPVAALATIKKHQTNRVADHLVQVGTQVQQGWKRAAESAGIQIHVDGVPPLSHFTFPYENSAALVTLFNQTLLDRGYLASNQFYATYAHDSEDIRGYLDAVEEAFAEIASALAHDDVTQRLRGPIKHSTFRRLT